MGKKREPDCAECFKGHLLEKGHAVGYEPGPDAPDYIFTIDGEKYSVEVTRVAGLFNIWVPQGVLDNLCKKINKKVQEIRKNSKREPQTGGYRVDFYFPLSTLSRKESEERVEWVADDIANEKSLGDSIAKEYREIRPPAWRIHHAYPADTLIIESASYLTTGFVDLNERALHLAERLRDKKEKIERNEPEKPKIILFYCPFTVSRDVVAAWEYECPELASATEDFDCILLIQQENDQYQVCNELIPLNRRS